VFGDAELGVARHGRPPLDVEDPARDAGNAVDRRRLGHRLDEVRADGGDVRREPARVLQRPDAASDGRTDPFGEPELPVGVVDVEGAVVRRDRRVLRLVDAGQEPAAFELSDQNLGLDERLCAAHVAGREAVGEPVDEVGDGVVARDRVVDFDVAVGVFRDGALADPEEVGDLALRPTALAEFARKQRPERRQELLDDDLLEEPHLSSCAPPNSSSDWIREACGPV